MSKNITLKSGGSATTYNGIDKIRVPVPDGGTEDWVPEDEVQLATITITANGEYTAEESEVYGFNKAIINVPKGDYIVGTDSSDGKQYKISKDAQTGSLVRTEIPVAIEVTTDPTKTAYEDGESLNYTGMVVTLKSKTGGIFTDSTYTTGAVPAAELNLPAEKAELGKTRVPVYWLSPYTSRVLKAVFEITVTEASE